MSFSGFFACFGFFARFRLKSHGRRAMVKQLDNNYESSRFEFDGEDGRGVQWRHGCSNQSVEKTVALFRSKGYTIVEWQDDV